MVTVQASNSATCHNFTGSNVEGIAELAVNNGAAADKIFAHKSASETTFLLIRLPLSQRI